MADGLLSIVIEILKSVIQSQIALLFGVKEELQSLESTLSTIEAVLEDAEQKQLRENSKAIKDWLRKLRSAAYQVDDILDECKTKALGMDSEGQKSGFTHRVQTCFLTTSPQKIWFRHTIGKQIKRVIKKLDAIAEERQKFHLSVGAADKQIKSHGWRETSSIITESKVYGREEDRKKIVQLLTEHASDYEKDIIVLPIIGIGGLGKTTLAQLIFHDKEVKDNFEPRIWICVSEDFDLQRILKAIIESITGDRVENLELDLLQKKIQEKLLGKRYFLVLDDVWSEDQDTWDKLKSSLACGSRGACILTTTRIEKVASIMGTIPPHRLSGLSEDDCWSLFKQRAFALWKEEEHSNLMKIGQEIVKKCGGVPLAAKTLGSLLQFTKDENDWIHVQESDIWNLPKEDNSILLPALRLSYYHLPISVRQCFGYSAVFPKDSQINKANLINMWMASGLLSSHERSEMEDVGKDMWNALYWRSFFQDVEEDDFHNIVSFTMHDLVHDLAQSIIAEEYLTMNVGSTRKIPPGKNIRHLTLVGEGNSIPKGLYEFQSLRTLIFYFRISVGEFEKIDFTKLGLLRVLDAKDQNIMKLPSSIGSLKRLRYLNLSKNYFTELPKSICNLCNLQTLYLSHCPNLQKLPKNMCCLRSLRHIYLEGCDRINEMPPGIGELSHLKTLTLFSVGGKEEDGKLSELNGLNLRGNLFLKNLEKVSNPKDAEGANLVAKRNLLRLELEWTQRREEDSSKSGEQAIAEHVLEALQPHSSLQSLVIRGYQGAHFPHWMEDSSVLRNIVFLKLDDCRNCVLHPILGQLPYLTEISVRGMKNVEYLDNEIPRANVGGNTVTQFPSLKRMDIYGLANLVRLSRSEEARRDLLPRLQILSIRHCPKLINLPKCLPSLEELEIDIFCNSALDSISHLHNLTSLEIAKFNGWVIPEGLLGKLTVLLSLTLENLRKLKELPTDLTNLTALKSLSIRHCDELESLPAHGLRGLRSLQTLVISHCNNLQALPDGFGYLTSLQELHIDDCPKLVDFPEGIQRFDSLQSLTLWNMQNLKALPELLQHAPALQYLTIENCPELASLPDWLGNLSTLQYLSIYGCQKLASLPASIQSLCNLQALTIVHCSQLTSRCEKGKEEDWPKIAHIPRVDIRWI